MPRSVLVGVDGSPESARAAVFGVALAGAMGGRCRLVHAIPDLRRFGVTGRVPLQQARQEARKRLEIALREAVPAEVLERLHVGLGRAGAVLTEEARRSNASVIVLGGKRRGAIARGAAGSTAHHLIRILSIPVLVTGPSARPAQRVLAAIDLSDAATATLREAERLAQLLGAELRVMHVIEPIRFPGVVPITRDDAEYTRQSEASFEALLAGDRRLAPESVVRHGVAEERIAAEAREWGADVIVLGSHGKGWADRLLIGSVAEHLLNELPTTLLVVPAAARKRAAPIRRRRRVGRIII